MQFAWLSSLRGQMTEMPYSGQIRVYSGEKRGLSPIAVGCPLSRNYTVSYFWYNSFFEQSVPLLCQGESDIELDALTVHSGPVAVEVDCVP